MGRAASKMSRRVTTRYNVEHRAQSFIEKQQTKPQPPPKLESTVQLLKQIEQKFPELKDAQSTKDTNLDDMLKHVHIESYGPSPEIKSLQKLPQDRSLREDPEFGHLEPVVIPRGKLSIRQLIEGLDKSLVSKGSYTYVEFAQEYDLDVGKAETIFHYFKPYTLYTDIEKERKEALQAGLEENEPDQPSSTRFLGSAKARATAVPEGNIDKEK